MAGEGSWMMLVMTDTSFGGWGSYAESAMQVLISVICCRRSLRRTG